MYSCTEQHVLVDLTQQTHTQHTLAPSLGLGHIHDQDHSSDYRPQLKWVIKSKVEKEWKMSMTDYWVRVEGSMIRLWRELMMDDWEEMVNDDKIVDDVNMV